MILTTTFMYTVLKATLPAALGACVSFFNGNKQRMLESAKFEESKRQWEISRTDRIKAQQDYFEKLMKVKFTDYFLSNSWPLSLSPEHFTVKENKQGQITLKVFLAKPYDADGRYKRILDSSKHKLQKSISSLSLIDGEHNIDFLMDVWKEGNHGMQSDIESLYSVIKGQPTLVLFPHIVTGMNKLVIYGAFWGIGEMGKHPSLVNFLELNLGEYLILAAKEYANKWRDTTISLPKTMLKAISSIDSKNLSILQKEEKYLEYPFGNNEIEEHFNIGQEYIVDDIRFDEVVSEVVASNINALINGISDIYYFIEYNVKPQLPVVLSFLEQPYYLPLVSVDTIKFYDTLRQFNDSNRTLFPEVFSLSNYSMREFFNKHLTKKISAKYSNDDFVTRILWDEFVSECFREILRTTNVSTVKDEIENHIVKILGEIEDPLPTHIVKEFVSSFLNDPTISSILFSYSTRHSMIKEVTHRSGIASYILYETMGLKGGVNWLITMRLADMIADKVNKNKNKTTSSIELRRDNKLLSQKLSSIYNSYQFSIDAEKIAEILSNGRFIENIRILADIIYTCRNTSI